MEKISDFYEDFKEYILFILLLIVFIIGFVYLFYHLQSSINNIKKEIKDRPVVEINSDTNNKLIVDVKGAVKKPGVYYLDEGKRVIDAINRAGGFTNSADSSVNNLSMKLKDEMVIIVYTKSEIKDFTKTKEKESVVIEKCKESYVTNSSCLKEINGEDVKEKEVKTTDSNKSSNKTATNETNAQEESKLISINDATKEELMTLPGIGESKAIAIIEYRKTKQFETIDEIKEVSGIGEALFEKIKANITT